jgi:hypothetical protein
MSNELTLKIDAGSDADEAERTELARHLRQTLLELSEVEHIEGSAATLPRLSKSVGPIDWSTLLVTLAASGGVVTTLINTVQSWLSRHPQTTITVKLGDDEIVMTGASPADQRRLINEWLRRRKA